MQTQQLLDDAGSVMTVISFATFMGIVGWTYLLHSRRDFDAAARLPFADDGAGSANDAEEN